mmetsp:Transcript_111999/g.219559  ORF Transcript_111999/g.219559 Transcript_111999/m.219559 type:complete len:244 (-) Transcript_111999:19-750(-)
MRWKLSEKHGGANFNGSAVGLVPLEDSQAAAAMSSSSSPSWFWLPACAEPPSSVDFPLDGSPEVASPRGLDATQAGPAPESHRTRPAAPIKAANATSNWCVSSACSVNGLASAALPPAVSPAGSPLRAERSCSGPCAKRQPTPKRQPPAFENPMHNSVRYRSGAACSSWAPCAKAQPLPRRHSPFGKNLHKRVLSKATVCIPTALQLDFAPPRWPPMLSLTDMALKWQTCHLPMKGYKRCPGC